MAEKTLTITPTSEFELSQNETKEYLKKIFEIQPSCITRTQYDVNILKLPAEQLSEVKVCPPALMLWGPPGIGKSSIVRQAAIEAGISENNFSDIRLSTLEPVDLRGIPSVVSGRTVYNPPDFFPIGQNEIDEILEKYGVKTLDEAKEQAIRKANREKVEQYILDRIEKALKENRGVLLFDELPSAQRDIQIAAYEIILDRKIGKYTLPIGWSIVAAGNRPSEVSGVSGTSSYLPIPLANRMIHIGVKSETKDWQAWALDHGFDPTVISFGMEELESTTATEQKRGYGPGEEPQVGVPAFLTPRSLEWLDYVVKQVDSGLIDTLDIIGSDVEKQKERDRIIKSLYRGAVGIAEATKFNYFRAFTKYLLNGEEIYNHPDLADKYFSILNKRELSESDVKELANIKAEASKAPNKNAIISDFVKNFSSSYDNYYKNSTLVRSYYPTMLLFTQYIHLFRQGKSNKDNFVAAGKAIIDNLSERDARAMLTMLQGQSLLLLKSEKGKSLELNASASAWHQIIESARKRKLER